jgi:hypothetical protein
LIDVDAEKCVVVVVVSIQYIWFPARREEHYARPCWTPISRVEGSGEAKSGGLDSNSRLEMLRKFLDLES